ncbi:hypothetical protein ACNJ7K_04135 [Rhodococcus aetherivorans]
MPIPPIIEAVLRTDYRLLRAPLAVLEQHLPHDRGQSLGVPP